MALLCMIIKAEQLLTRGDAGKEVSADHKGRMSSHLELLKIKWLVEGLGSLASGKRECSHLRCDLSSKIPASYGGISAC